MTETTNPPSTPLGRAPLRVGLLLDAWVAPAWVARVVDEIQTSGVATIELVILNGSSQDPAPWRKVVELRGSLAYIAYRKLDALVFGAPGDPMEPVDLRQRLADVPVRTVRPIQSPHRDAFPPDAIEALRAADLDVLLRFGFRILTGDVLKVARHGVWSHHHGDVDDLRGGPAGFWEVMEGRPTTSACLQVLSEELDGGRPILRTTGRTDRVSVHRNNRANYAKASAFVGRALRALAEDGVVPEDRASPWRPYSDPVYKGPGNVRMVGLMARIGGRYLRLRWSRLVRRERWLLAYRWRPGGDDTPDGVLHRFKLLEPPSDRIWADPFVVADGDRRHVFAEEIRDGVGHGTIIVMTFEAGAWSEPVVVLDDGTHRSYPTVVDVDGTWYLMTESAANRRVDAFRALDFPTRWTFDRTVLDDVQAVDPTIVRIGDRWWLFVNIAQPGASNDDELHLFSADGPLGPWRPHRRNPIRSDVRGARPAGRPFEVDGAWFRPSQDGSLGYGGSTIVHRIERLDDDTYEERAVSFLRPRWRRGLRGIHTINAAGGLTVVDAERREWRLPRLPRIPRVPRP